MKTLGPHEKDKAHLRPKGTNVFGKIVVELIAARIPGVGETSVKWSGNKEWQDPVTRLVGVNESLLWEVPVKIAFDWDHVGYQVAMIESTGSPDDPPILVRKATNISVSAWSMMMGKLQTPSRPNSPPRKQIPQTNKAKNSHIVILLFFFQISLSSSFQDYLIYKVSKQALIKYASTPAFRRKKY